MTRPKTTNRRGPAAGAARESTRTAPRPVTQGALRQAARAAASDPPPREHYHHGDLRRVLLEAGLELARKGGPEAVVLREVTRRAGVVPNAAYRHFENRDALLAEVRSAALAALARGMEDEIRRLQEALGGKAGAMAHARARLQGVGAGYLRFAREETGLFRTAFSWFEAPPDLSSIADKAGPSGLNPFELLCAALDAMVEAGVLPAARRPGAEYLAWSAVHGMALLAIEGPLVGIDDPTAAALGQRLIQMVEQGLA